MTLELGWVHQSSGYGEHVAKVMRNEYHEKYKEVHNFLISEVLSHVWHMNIWMMGKGTRDSL